MDFTEERKHLIGLIAYRFAELCSEYKLDGYYISTMVKITEEAEKFEFPLDEDGYINTDMVYLAVDSIVKNLIDTAL